MTILRDVIYNIKRIGPRIELFGIPYWSFLVSESAEASLYIFIAISRVTF